MAQAYAAILGILLTVGVAFTQLGTYRIPVPLLMRLSIGETLTLILAGLTVVVPVAALTFDALELYRLCFVLFVIGIAILPAFAARMVQRTTPAFYVPRLLRARQGWSVFGDTVVAIAIQAAEKRDWRALEMMAALLGQLRHPDPFHHMDRGWGYQEGLPRLIHHLVDSGNDRGLRAVLGSVRHGVSVTPITSILDVDETRSRFRNWLRRSWLVRPAWVHRLQARKMAAEPLLSITDSYDYGILMHLSSGIASLTHVDEDRPGEPFLPKRVSGFREWAELLATVIFSAYLLDEAAKDDATTPAAESALWQVRSWAGLLGTVDPRLLRDVLVGTPRFPGGFGPMYPLHYPKDLVEKSKAHAARLTPAKVRAANRLVQTAVERQLVVHPDETSQLFWPEWRIEGEKALASGRRFKPSGTT
jgi:hypothetical protein